MFLALLLHYSISTVLNVRTNDLSLGDVIEVFRPVIYLLVFFFSLIILTPYVKQCGKRQCLDFFENIIFYASFFEFLKYYEAAAPLFYFYTPFKYGTINYIRLSGFTGFAYAYAWILLICIIYNAVKSRGRIGFRLLYYSFLVLGTGSRTGIAALLFLYGCLFVLERRTRPRLFLLAVMLSLIVFVLYSLEFEFIVTSIDYTIRLIQTFLGYGGGDGSLATRTMQMRGGLDHLSENPLYGSASNKLSDMRIENFYFHHLGTWGIMGLILYLLIIFSVFFMIPRRTERRIYGLLIASSFILCFSSPIFDQVRLFNIFYAIAAILIVKEACHEPASHKTS
jgi:hypothetical protein